MSLGEAVVEVGADASGFRGDVQRQVGGAMDAATRNAQQSVSTLSRTIRRAAVVGFGALTYGAVSFVKSSIDIEKQFSTTMRTLQAATQASADEMSSLNDLAIKLGADTSFSAQEAADSMLELGKAGLSTAEIIAAVPEAMNLAATEGIALDRASGIVTASLAQFNLKADRAGEVVNALAGASNASRSSVEGLGESMKLVGSAGAGIGLTVQEVAGALAALSDSGLEGSIAGTSLAAVFNRLTPTTTRAKDAMKALNLDFTDAKGNFDSIDVIAGKLQKSFQGMDAESRKIALGDIFGKDASVIAAVNALIRSGEEGLQDYTKAASDTSAAQKLATARMGGTEGALERLSGSIETAKLVLGQQLAPVIENVADRLAEGLVPAIETVIDGGKQLKKAVAPAFSAFSDSLRDLAGSGESVTSGFQTFVALLRTASEIIGGALSAFNSLPGPVKELAIQAGLAAAVLPKVTAGITGVMTAAKASSLGTFVTDLRAAEAGAGRTSIALGGLKSVAKQAAGIGGILALTSGLSEASEEGNTFSSVMKNAAGGAGIGAMFGPVGALVGAGAGAGLGALVGAFGGAKEAAKETRLELLKQEGFKNATEDAESLADALDGVVHAYGQVSREAIKTGFVGEDGKLDQDIALLRDLGVSMDTIVSATLGQEAAQRRVNEALSAGLGPAQENLATLKARYEDAKDGAIDLVTATGQIITNGQQIDAQTIGNYKAEYEGAKVTVEDLLAAQETFGTRIDQNTGAIRTHKQEVAALAADLGLTVAKYQEFPREVRTRFEAEGLPQTSADAVRLIGQYKALQNFRSIRAVVSAPGVDLTRTQVQKLAKQYDLTPKQVRTLIRLEGVEKVAGDSDKVKGKLKDTGNVKVDASTFTQSIKTMLSNGGGIADREGGKVKRNLRDAGKVKIDGQWANSLETSLSKAKGLASTGGRQVGGNLKSGVLAGLSGLTSALSANVTAAVNAAIEAGRRAADAHSPSRKMMQLGWDLTEGLEIGIEQGAPKATQKMIEALDDLQDKTRQRLSSLRQEFVSLSDAIAGAITPDLFEATTFEDFWNRGVSAFGDLSKLRGALKKLRKWGIDPQFLAQLFQSGNTALILDLAEGTRREAKMAAGIFSDITGLAGGLGRSIAKDVLGPKIDRTNKLLAQINDALAAFKKAMKRDDEKGNGKGKGKGKGNEATSARPIPRSAAAPLPTGAASGYEEQLIREVQALRAEVAAQTPVLAAQGRSYAQALNGVVSEAQVRRGRVRVP